MTPHEPMLSRHTIIAGFGLPGRAAAEALQARGVPHCVIELNPATVERCEKAGMPIIEGDCTDPQVLRQAGIEQASAIVIVIPDEKAALEATAQARQLSASIRILTRCHYVSAGIEAKSRGANDIIVAEQVVAAEVSRLLGGTVPGDSDHR